MGAVLALAQIWPCHAAELQTELRLACNARLSWVRVGDADDAAWADLPEGTRVSNPPLPYFGRARQTTSWGNHYRLPAKVKMLRCGALTLKLQMRALHHSPDGNMGLVTFPSVEISAFDRPLVGLTGIAECDMSESRYRYFGACPGDYAKSVTVSMPRRDAVPTISIVRAYVEEWGQPLKYLEYVGSSFPDVGEKAARTFRARL
jgi:hypothetical protein